MKASTKEWLSSSMDDLETIEAILMQNSLTNIIAFHAQQCVEKCLKAIHEEFAGELLKSHNLIRLYESVKSYLPDLLIEFTLLEKLTALYTDSRYPAEFGLLPNGKPSLREAEELYTFA